MKHKICLLFTIITPVFFCWQHLFSFILCVLGLNVEYGSSSLQHFNTCIKNLESLEPLGSKVLSLYCRLLGLIKIKRTLNKRLNEEGTKNIHVFLHSLFFHFHLPLALHCIWLTLMKYYVCVCVEKLFLGSYWID